MVITHCLHLQWVSLFCISRHFVINACEILGKKNMDLRQCFVTFKPKASDVNAVLVYLHNTVALVPFTLSQWAGPGHRGGPF